MKASYASDVCAHPGHRFSSHGSGAPLSWETGSRSVRARRDDARRRVVVTGVAGFIGSHVAERLLARGFAVDGIDCFTDYYDVALKRRNLGALVGHEHFRLHELDLRTADVGAVLDGARYVVHLAAQPGVRASWGGGLRACMDHNVVALGNLLDRSRSVGLSAIVLASSSSVYGHVPEGFVGEDDALRPISPYGVSKVAAEALCTTYTSAFDLPTVMLRYFTVYGPRQRPDMLIGRLLSSAAGDSDEPVPIYGDGRAARDFTYVGDVADATIDGMTAGLPAGTVLNIASGTPVTVDAVLSTVTRVTGRAPLVDYRRSARGDVRRTAADTRRAAALLGWRSSTSLAEGIAVQARWMSLDLHRG